MASEATHSERRLSQGIIALVFAVVFFVSARTHADPDLWGHVRFGQDILSEGIPTTDSYSYLNGDVPWVNHELLAEILFGAAFKFMGVPGLVALKTGLALLMFGLLYSHLRRCGLNEVRSGIVMVAVLMLMSVGMWTIRPQLLTYVLFLLTILLIDRAERGSRTAIWMLPPVMLVWANSHGGFLAGIAVVAIWVAVRVVSHFMPDPWRVRSNPSSTTVILTFILCVAATLVNPYGPRLLTFLLETATVARPEIGEWQPVSITTPEGAAYVIVVAGTIAAFLRSRRPRRLSTIAVLFAVALLPLVALRHLPLFGLAFAVFAGEHLADFWDRAIVSRDIQPRLIRSAPWVAAAAFVVAAVPHFNCIRIDPSFIRFTKPNP